MPEKIKRERCLCHTGKRLTESHALMQVLTSSKSQLFVPCCWLTVLLYVCTWRSSHVIWRPPSLSELTPYQITSGLTHLGSEASIYTKVLSLYLLHAVTNSQGWFKNAKYLHKLSMIILFEIYCDVENHVVF